MIPIINQIIQNNTPLIISCIKSQIKVLEKDLLNLLLISFGNEWQKEKYKLANHNQVENVLNEPGSRSIKFLLWTPQINQNEFTVFINNFSDGWITLLNQYSFKHKKEIVMATLSNESSNYPIYRFYYRDKSNVRVVQVQKEIKDWEFYEEGQPLIIEDINNYNKRNIIHRLNNNIIENYMKKLGFDYTKNEFWLSKAETIEYTLTLQ